MRNDVQRIQGGVPRNGKGAGFFTRRAFSNYLKIVSSGASNVASTVRQAGATVANSIAEKEDSSASDQVYWAGFDKLETVNGLNRRVLLLGYKSGFQIWDVEDADDVRQLVSRHDGPVSFLQIVKKPLPSKSSDDKFCEVRPLIAIAGDGFPSLEGSDVADDNLISTTIHFYSLKTHAYVHVLKFRSAIFTIRSGPRVVAVSQANQIHCFDAATLEREYTILTNPIVSECAGSGGIGYGPLAVGPRWLAYSGSPVVVSNSGRVMPEILTPSSVLSTSPNSSLVAHYAMESSKQLANGFKTLGDIGYKKLSKYCSEFLPDGTGLRKSPVNVQLPDSENAGMVIVRDLVSKTVVVQFRAHKSPISALSFDPSGILLVTASVHGHNINVFRIMPSATDAGGSNTHLYTLQRGLTNAVIQDISFSDDSQWIMISSSRGTSHLFPISSDIPRSNETLVTSHKSTSQHVLLYRGPPLTLSAVRRIRNGSNGLIGAVSGAAAAATGRANLFSGAVASAFHNPNGSHSLGKKYHLLVFCPSGCVMQYVLRPEDCPLDSHELGQGSDASLVVEAVQKWDICYKKKRRDQGETVDIYGEQRVEENRKHFQRGAKKSTSVHPTESDEKRHLYISEVELRTHEAEIPLWAKSEIYFQAMVECPENLLGGEIEVESVPTRTVEARSKDLIPVFDYLRIPPKPQQPNLCGPEMAAVAEQLIGLDDGVYGKRVESVNRRGEEETARVENVNNKEEDSDGNSGPLLELVDNDRESPKKIMTYFADDDHDID